MWTSDDYRAYSLYTRLQVKYQNPTLAASTCVACRQYPQLLNWLDSIDTSPINRLFVMQNQLVLILNPRSESYALVPLWEKRDDLLLMCALDLTVWIEEGDIVLPCASTAEHPCVPD